MDYSLGVVFAFFALLAVQTGGTGGKFEIRNSKFEIYGGWV